MSHSDAPWPFPAAFDEYRLLRPLGRGAMGQVFLGQDTLLDRYVAVKVIAGISPDAALRERLRVEARAIARVHHPNVVEVYRVGSVQGYPYLVSELVRGESLDHLPLPLPWQRVLLIAIGLARGLSAAHRRGVLHRDIKPANVMLTEEGEVKLLDFGVAKLLDAGGGAVPAAASVRPGAPAPGGGGPSAVETLDADERLAPAPGAAPATGLIGTPRYMAPERWRREPATARSDLYSLGVMLYELCSGDPPYSAGTLEALRARALDGRLVPLAQRAPEVDAPFAAVIDRCLARAPEERFSSADALREALEALQVRSRPIHGRGDRPYPGLHSFGTEDRSAFRGRDAEVRVVLERLRGEPLVVVAGDSGTGKSSLCRAGVLPAVADGALAAAERWITCEILPGRRPFRALAAGLASCLAIDVEPLVEAGPRELARQVAAAAGPRGLLLCVDQLEEALTLGAPEELEPFSWSLEALAGFGPRVRILASARGDFLTRLVTLPGLGEHLAAGLYLLPHIREAGLREAIVAPARGQGFAFESEAMVDGLVAAGSAEGGLPLLQFALAELWERRDLRRSVIPAEALAAIGGVEGALARHADSVLANLRPGQRAAARRVLGSLVLAEGTRARRARLELAGDGDAEAGAALEALVRGRLVLARETTGEGGQATYELAHEALLRSWDTLRGWLASDEEQRARRQRLERACAEWDRLGRPREQLWGRLQLREARALEGEALSPAEAAFLGASRRAARRRTLFTVAAVLLGPLSVAGAYGALQLQSWRAREREAAQALAGAGAAMARASASHQRVEEARSEAFNAFDEGRDAQAESAWSRALAGGTEEVAAYDDAVAILDRALTRDGSRPELRRRLAEVLYRYLLVAERDHRGPVRALLQRRLDAIDDTREYHARLHAPASLALKTDPGSAAVQIEQALEAGEGAHQKMRWVPVPLPASVTPLADVSLPPGSYRLRLERPDRPPVLYPVLLRRGERVAFDVPVPARVPDGYAYVAPGRFLSGSADDEDARLEVPAPPIHPVDTGGFLIARHEVTYGEWIAFLRTLAPDERAQRRPHGANYFGSLSLDEAGDGRWELVLRREIDGAQREYRAREGARFVYPQRDHRADQDWLRFPVSSISWEDARAYLAWLDRTGHLPGARLCTRVEWERAARGADGREYPSGNWLDPEDANFDLTYGQQNLAFGPDEVGSHPASDSPFGVSDMAGNVWEWVAIEHRRNPAAYVGGGFYQARVASRSLNYGPGEASFRWPFIGLRVCAPAPPP